MLRKKILVRGQRRAARTAAGRRRADAARAAGRDVFIVGVRGAALAAGTAPAPDSGGTPRRPRENPMAPTAPTPPIDRRAWSVLVVSTLAFTTCFMVWMMFGVIGIPIRKQLNLNATEFGLLTATPVLTGSLVRVPLGIWTDRYGGRIVMAILMALTVPAIWLMAYATQYWHFLVIGLFVGLAGGSV